MYILDIIPIAKGFPDESYTYFHNQLLNLGSLVEIKIKNRKILGLVNNISLAKSQKLNIKTKKFTLKKIEKVIQENFIDEIFFQSLKDIAILQSVKINDILSNYFPNFIYDNSKILNNKDTLKSKRNRNTTNYLLEDLTNRQNEYLKLTQKEFKKNNSIVIFTPTILEVETLENYFKRNISNKNILSFHSKLSNKNLKENLKKLNSKNLFLIISTPSLFPILIKDKINLETIVLDNEISPHYLNNLISKPIDFREVIKKVSLDLNLNLLISGRLLTMNTYLEAKENKVEVRNNNQKLNLKLISQNKDDIEEKEIKNNLKILKNNQKTNSYNKVYFSEELIDKLENLKKNSGKGFLFVKRKGLYPVTICEDCQNIFTCPKCDKPYLLVKNKAGDKIYQCQNCKEILNLDKNKNLICQNCNSWRMKTLGIGSEAVAKNLKEIGFKTFILDSDQEKTKKEILKTIQDWQNEKEASILIGTELALNFLNTDYRTDLVSIISLDSLFAIPEIDIDSKIFNLILELNEKTRSKNEIIIQTRLMKQSIWKYILNNQKVKFLEDELKLRKQLNLPPFTITLNWKIEAKNEKLKNNFEKILKRIVSEEKLNTEPIWKIDKKNNLYEISLTIPKNLYQNKKDKKITPTSLTRKLYSLSLSLNIK